MVAITRRSVLTSVTAAAALGAGAYAAVSHATHSEAAPMNRPPGGGGTATTAPSPTSPVLIGDGSTSDTGPQPNQPVPQRLEPGEKPPQFVVFSWDGAGVDDRRLFERFRQTAQDTKATMTFFLSGLYLLPESKKDLYHPPGKPVGASAIGYLKDEHIHETIQQLTLAWQEGHEIGTHYNGHFCDSHGVGSWTSEQWRSEIDQAVSFVKNWKTNTGFTDLPPLPFDYDKALTGSRTPCLMGRDNLLPTAAQLGWTYDASSPGGLQQWPRHYKGLWEFPLQSIPFPGHSFQVLSMDYNMLANQSDGKVNGDPSQRPTWKQQAVDAYMAGFNRAYTTNRAPYFIGNHFEGWNGGIYMDAVDEVVHRIAGTPDVRLVSFRQLVQWLEVQDPSVITKLRTLNVGQTPDDWRTYTTPDSATTSATPSAGA